MLDKTMTLDVRADLQRGGSPLGRILAGVGRLAPKQQLVLIAPFLPSLLIELLAGQGFEHEAQPTETGDFEIRFTRRPPVAVDQPKHRAGVPRRTA